MLTTITWNSLGQRVKRVFFEIESTGQFLFAFIKAPARVGSVCPSSRVLAARLTAAVPGEDDGLIIDLGAGSGPVTAQLLRAGVSPERIIAIEADKSFAAPFARRCGALPLTIADARQLKSVLDAAAPGKRIGAIISSLPFRTMPSGLVGEILREVRKVMRERGGVLIQYSYAWWMHYPLRQYGLRPCYASVVMRNLPPARVEVYREARPLIFPHKARAGGRECPPTFH